MTISTPYTAIIIISCVMCPKKFQVLFCFVFCSVPDVMTMLSAVIIIINCVMCPHLTEFKASGKCFVFLHFFGFVCLFSTPCHDYTFSSYNNCKLSCVHTEPNARPQERFLRSVPHVMTMISAVITLYILPPRSFNSLDPECS